MQRTIAAILVLAGLALGGWTLVDDTGDDVGAVTVGATPAADEAAAEEPLDDDPASDESTTETGTDAPTTRTTPAPAPTPAVPAIGRSSGRIGDIDLSGPPAPVDITMPSIGIDARIVPVGIDPDGLMTVPEDVSTVGWYEFGASPASAEGTTVLAGHVDDRVQGRGAFFDLRAMEVGDELTLTDDEGSTTTWVVTGRRTFEKESLPVDDIYRRDGAPRLVLITCGGDFDRAARSYESNVVVEAEPLR